MNNHRIYRTNSLNITIQKKTPSGEWQTQSYHGNSMFSLVSGLLELAVAQHVPGNDTLLEQLKTMKSDVAAHVRELEKLIKEYCNAD